MNNFNRFTIKAQEALQNAQDIAGKENHGELKALHLLAALVEDENTLVVPVLAKAGISVEDLKENIYRELKKSRRFYPAEQCHNFIFHRK